MIKIKSKGYYLISGYVVNDYNTNEKVLIDTVSKKRHYALKYNVIENEKHVASFYFVSTHCCYNKVGEAFFQDSRGDIFLMNGIICQLENNSENVWRQISNIKRKTYKCGNKEKYLKTLENLYISALKINEEKTNNLSEEEKIALQKQIAACYDNKMLTLRSAADLYRYQNKGKMNLYFNTLIAHIKSECSC